MIDKLYNTLVNFNYDSDSRIKTLLQSNPDLQQKLKDAIINFVNTYKGFDNLRLLEDNKHKEIVTNPLFDLLRELSIQLSPNIQTTIFDLLQNESDTLSGLFDITEYVKMPDLIEQVENAKSILKVAKAILSGMEDSTLDDNNLFGYNNQIAKYLNKFKNGVNADKYQTLESKHIYTIGADLDLLLNKLDFINQLANKNNASKTQEDRKTKEIFCKTIIEKIKTDASKLQINGVSILLPEDLSALEDDSIPIFIRMGRLQVALYKNL